MFINPQTYLGSVVLSFLGDIPINLGLEFNMDTENVNFTFKGFSSKCYVEGFDATMIQMLPMFCLLKKQLFRGED